MARLLLAYHFFHPDDVVGARLFSDLAVEQVRRGWEVEVLTSNRLWHNPQAELAAEERWNDVLIHRVYRPPLGQARPLPRLANTAWMTAAWLARSLPLGRFDAIVIGSDPAFAVALALALRRTQPRAAIVHWCFDLYPEAIVAEGLNLPLLEAPARALMAAAYRVCDALVDLGPKMRERLEAYPSAARRETLPPWALTEADVPAPTDEPTRVELFPGAELALLYSGTMGRAHEFEPFLRLARACRARSGDAIALSFAARGNRHEELRRAVGPADSNVRFAPFADEATLPRRLAAADLHLASVRQEWAGVVVPSKFFASLGIGRPILYAGPTDSEMARWIAEHDVGLHLRDDNVDAVADRLDALRRDRAALTRWRENALAVYRRQWSKQVTNDRWDELLRELVRQRAEGPG